MRTYHIYTLSNPKNGEVFYVGCAVDPNRRFREHLSSLDNVYGLEYHQQPRINYMVYHQIFPVMDVVDSIECAMDREAELLEIFWIQQFKAWGFTLMNVNDAGPGRKAYLSSLFGLVKPFKEYKESVGAKLRRDAQEREHQQWKESLGEDSLTPEELERIRAKRRKTALRQPNMTITIPLLAIILTSCATVQYGERGSRWYKTGQNRFEGCNYQKKPVILRSKQGFY